MKFGNAAACDQAVIEHLVVAQRIFQAAALNERLRERAKIGISGRKIRVGQRSITAIGRDAKHLLFVLFEVTALRHGIERIFITIFPV